MMAAITLAEARSQLSAWLTASKKVAAGQSYQIGNRQLTRVNAEHIDKMINYWQGMVNKLESGTSGPRAFRVVPRDL
jgi:hypothetical protein